MSIKKTKKQLKSCSLETFLLYIIFSACLLLLINYAIQLCASYLTITKQSSLNLARSKFPTQ